MPIEAPSVPPAPGPAEPPLAGRPLASRLTGWAHRNRASIALVVLAVTIPELLTGSTPVTNLVNPIAVAGLLGFYGAGALAIREASVRFRRGYTMVLLLGLAYGVAEEGIATKTMVDPGSGAAGFLGVYGHAVGVNWVFAVVIALFHALYSIAIPILLVELLYPETKGRRLVSDRGAEWALVILGLAVAWGYFGFDPRYFEGYAVLGLLFAVLGTLIAAAFVTPSRWLYPPSFRPTLSPGAFLVLGASFASGWSIFYLVAPHLVPVPLFVILAEMAAALSVLGIVVPTVGRTGNERHKVFLAVGLLSWYLPWDVIVTFALGDYLIGLVLAAVFVLLWRLARAHPEVDPPRAGDRSTAGITADPSGGGRAPPASGA